MSLSIALAVPHAHAEGIDVLEIEADTCPSRELIEAQFAPLLDEELRAILAEAPPIRVRIVDSGHQYRIEVGTESRWIDDVERDCVERARVASVFIAMNLAANISTGTMKEHVTPAKDAVTSAVTDKEADADDGGDSAVEDSAPENQRGARLEVMAGLELAVAPIAGIETFGFGAGVALHSRSWLFSVRSAVLAPGELEFSSSSRARGAVDVMRIPNALGIAWLSGKQALEVGPQVALVADVLVFQGRDLPAPRSAVRANPGAMAGLVVRGSIARGLRIFSSITAAAYPLDYRLQLAPAHTVGHAPRLWLGVHFGLTREAFR